MDDLTTLLEQQQTHFCLEHRILGKIEAVLNKDTAR